MYEQPRRRRESYMAPLLATWHTCLGSFWHDADEWKQKRVGSVSILLDGAGRLAQSIGRVQCWWVSQSIFHRREAWRERAGLTTTHGMAWHGLGCVRLAGWIPDGREGADGYGRRHHDRADGGARGRVGWMAGSLATTMLAQMEHGRRLHARLTDRPDYRQL